MKLLNLKLRRGKPFVNYWMHCKFLLVNNEKMSKSKGNFFTLRDLIEKGYTATAIRYLLLSHNYGHPLNLTFDGLTAAEASVFRVNEFVRNVKGFPADPKGGDFNEEIAEVKKNFDESLDDDLNIARALAALFGFISTVNQKMASGVSVSSKGQSDIVMFMQSVDSVLGIIECVDEQVPAEVAQLGEDRKKAKSDKDFALADQLRDAIQEHGWIIKDRPGGEYSLEKK